MNWANLSKRGQQCLASWLNRVGYALRREWRRQHLRRRRRDRLRVRRDGAVDNGRRVTPAELAVALALLALLLFSAPVLGWWSRLLGSWLAPFLPWAFIVLLAFLLRRHTHSEP